MPRKTSVIGGNGDAPSMSDATAGIKRQVFPVNMVGMPFMPMAAPEQIRQATMDLIRALMLIRNYSAGAPAFRPRSSWDRKTVASFEPDPESYGFTTADMDRPIFINYVLGLESATLRQIVEILEQTYCGKIGVEFMHIQEPEEKA